MSTSLKRPRGRVENPILVACRRRGVRGYLEITTGRFIAAIAGGEPTRLEQLRAAVTTAVTRMQEAYDALEAADPADENVDVDALQRAFDAAETQHTTATAALERHQKVAEARRNAPVAPANPDRPDSPEVRIRREPLTYERHKGTDSWLLDLARDQFGLGDVDGAKRRLRRHGDEITVELEKREQAAEKRLGAALDEMLAGLPDPVAAAIHDRGLVGRERRAMDRVDGSGGHFVPPIWLLEEYAAFPRAGRPFVEECRQIALPSGTDSINVPRITQGSLTGLQTADGAAVTSQDMTDAVVTAPVRTIAGQVDLALQLLEQSPLAFDEVVFADLVADYFLRCDAQAINGSGAAGQVLGILNVAGLTTVTYTDASPTVPELYPKIADALNQGETLRKAPLTHGWIAPRRFWWASAALDAQSRPLVVPQLQGPMNAVGVPQLGGATIEDQVLTMLAMFRKDHSIPVNLGAGTNEDRVILTRNSDHLWFEGTVRARALMEPLSGNLQARLQIYSYVAFTAGRYPSGTSVIAGTGLATPTF